MSVKLGPISKFKEPTPQLPIYLKVLQILPFWNDPIYQGCVAKCKERLLFDLILCDNSHKLKFHLCPSHTPYVKSKIIQFGTVLEILKYEVKKFENQNYLIITNLNISPKTPQQAQQREIHFLQGCSEREQSLSLPLVGGRKFYYNTNKGLPININWGTRKDLLESNPNKEDFKNYFSLSEVLNEFIETGVQPKKPFLAKGLNKSHFFCYAKINVRSSFPCKFEITIQDLKKKSTINKLIFWDILTTKFYYSIQFDDILLIKNYRIKIPKSGQNYEFSINSYRSLLKLPPKKIISIIPEKFFKINTLINNNFLKSFDKLQNRNDNDQKNLNQNQNTNSSNNTYLQHISHKYNNNQDQNHQNVSPNYHQNIKNKDRNNFYKKNFVQIQTQKNNLINDNQMLQQQTQKQNQNKRQKLEEIQVKTQTEKQNNFKNNTSNHYHQNNNNKINNNLNTINMKGKSNNNNNNNNNSNDYNNSNDNNDNNTNINTNTNTNTCNNKNAKSNSNLKFNNHNNNNNNNYNNNNTIIYNNNDNNTNTCNNQITVLNKKNNFKLNCNQIKKNNFKQIVNNDQLDQNKRKHRMNNLDLSEGISIEYQQIKRKRIDDEQKISILSSREATVKYIPHQIIDFCGIPIYIGKKYYEKKLETVNNEMNSSFVNTNTSAKTTKPNTVNTMYTNLTKFTFSSSSSLSKNSNKLNCDEISVCLFIDNKDGQAIPIYFNLTSLTNQMNLEKMKIGKICLITKLQVLQIKLTNSGSYPFIFCSTPETQCIFESNVNVFNKINEKIRSIKEISSNFKFKKKNFQNIYKDQLFFWNNRFPYPSKLIPIKMFKNIFNLEFFAISEILNKTSNKIKNYGMDFFLIQGKILSFFDDRNGVLLFQIKSSLEKDDTICLTFVFNPENKSENNCINQFLNYMYFSEPRLNKMKYEVKNENDRVNKSKKLKKLILNLPFAFCINPFYERGERIKYKIIRIFQDDYYKNLMNQC
ncbi:rpa-related protein radx [Anaeramoeba flamelloides]|uniref:Rpa-related protein radx n=1 Tax=Anaeramoeba flamelloides TaxID=1746091 RepID=A0ABQ8YI01_9EUKA|nr:rpa-related protein radx [Anaeramoeba flamelloides]